jgi:hypothetical protein
MLDTLHLDLTDEELKDLLRRGFAYSGHEAAMPEEALDEFALLVRRFGFAALLEVLESAEEKLSRPPA